MQREKHSSIKLSVKNPQNIKILTRLEKDKSIQVVTTDTWYQYPETLNSEESTDSTPEIENEHNYSKDKEESNFIHGIYSNILDSPSVEEDVEEVSAATQSLEVLLNEKKDESTSYEQNFQDIEEYAVKRTTLSTLSRHGKSVLSEQFLCDICGRILGSKQALRKHNKSQHTNDQLAGKVFRNRVEVIIPQEKSSNTATIDQLSTSIGEISNTIAQLSASTKQPKKTISFLSKTINQLSDTFDQFICSTVDLSATADDKSSRISLTDAVPGTSQNEDTLVTMYKCEADSSTSAKKICFCDVCGKGFANKYTLSTHKTFHTGIRPFNCQYCPKTFKTKGQMQTHERRHFKEEEGEKTGLETESTDSNSSSKSKKEICDLCGHSFVNKYVLATHRKFHSGNKPFRCRHCDKFFKTKGQVKAHEKRHEK